MKRLYLSDTVAVEIGNYIVDRELAPGAKLPSVAEWMKRLHVGRSTLREGLKRLEAEGVIQILNGKGIFVGDPQTFRIFSRLQITDGRRHLLEMLDVRQVLEQKAIALATLHGMDSQFDSMARHLADYETAREEDDFLRVHEADAAFHMEIYRASGNQALVELIRSIHAELYVSWEAPSDRNQVFDASFPHHVTLLAAMRGRDVAAAETAFEQLMAATRQNVESI